MLGPEAPVKKPTDRSFCDVGTKREVFEAQNSNRMSERKHNGSRCRSESVIVSEKENRGNQTRRESEGEYAASLKATLRLLETADGVGLRWALETVNARLLILGVTI